MGWSSASIPHILVEAFANATTVISAWDGDLLVGVARCISDKCWSASIDCVIVRPKYQMQGIGTRMLNTLLEEMGDIKYINVSPDCKNNATFYQKFGFEVQTNGCSMMKCN